MVASDLPPVTDIGQSLDDGSSLVLVDVDTGDRVAAWAELDQNTSDADGAPLLIIPAAALAEGHRHAVGLRGLRRTDGTEGEPTAEFAEAVARPDALAEVWLGALKSAGVDPQDLDVAWGFTVGSTDDISGRLRHMWSETSAAVGDGAPPFTVTSTTSMAALAWCAGPSRRPTTSKVRRSRPGPGQRGRPRRHPDEHR